MVDRISNLPETYKFKDFGVEKPPLSYQLIEFIYTHPRLYKVTTFALALLALAALATLPVSLPIFATGAITLAVVTGIISIISLVAYSKFSSKIGFPHDMRSHAYKRIKEGELAYCPHASLEYINNVPVLTISSDDPREVGKSHGYILGAAIHSLRNRFRQLGLLHKPKKIKPVIQEIEKNLDKEFIREMEGLRDGFNQWARERKFWHPDELTLEDVISFHLVPEHIHFRPVKVAKDLKPAQATGCTAVVDSKDGELAFGRTVDWPSGGMAGPFSLIIKSKTPNMEYLMIGIPGITGPITGMNNGKDNAGGLSLSMNVCKAFTESVNGTPAVFLNKKLLQNCSTVKEAREFLKNETPLGPYHLTLCDPKEALVCRLKQADGPDSHVFSDGQPIQYPFTVTNEPKANLKPCEKIPNIFWNEQRKRVLGKFLKENTDMKPTELVSESLGLPYVNNPFTTQAIVILPGAEDDDVILRVAFDNAFVGYAKLHDLNKNQLFPKTKNTI